MGNRAVILTKFGEGVSVLKVGKMILQLRQFLPERDYRIYVFTDDYEKIGDGNTKVVQVKPMWASHSRYGWRNCDYWRIAGADMKNPATFMTIDLDMLILDDRFVNGFDYAERFGVAMPTNPRQYVGADAVLGFDPDGGLRGCCATALNTSPIFFNKAKGKKLLEAYVRQYLKKPTRAPAVWWRAIKASGQYPYILSEQWSYCHGEPVKLDNWMGTLKPIMIHGNCPENIALFERMTAE